MYLSSQRGANSPVANVFLEVVWNHTWTAGKGGDSPGEGAVRTLLRAWNSVEGRKPVRDLSLKPQRSPRENPDCPGVLLGIPMLPLQQRGLVTEPWPSAQCTQRAQQSRNSSKTRFSLYQKARETPQSLCPNSEQLRSSKHASGHHVLQPPGS